MYDNDFTVTHTKFMIFNDWKLRTAARLIKSGGVIAYPTETVWGLGCDPFQAKAVERILHLKKRAPAKGLILLSTCADDYAALLSTLNMTQRQQILDSQFQGPATTWLVPDHNHVIPEWIKGEHSCVAIRLTKHPLLLGLRRYYSGPIVSTSANPAGQKTANTRIRLRQYFGETLDCILPGECSRGATPSRIIDIMTGNILR